MRKNKIMFGCVLAFTLIFTGSIDAHFGHQITKTTQIGGIPYMYVDHGGSGDWMPHFQEMVTKTVSSTSTWSIYASHSAITKNDIVRVPEGVTLTIDTNTPVFHTLVVEGNVTFSSQKNTELKVGTIVVYPTGSLVIKTPNKNIKTTITLTGYKPYDPSEFTLGILSFGGIVDIAGASPSLSYSKIKTAAGASSVTVEANFKPNIGDELIFSDSQTADATHWSYSHHNINLVSALPQKWEMRKVTAVNANTVTLDAPLQYAHEDYVANISRNVVIKSGSSDQRAHVMLMGPTKVSIKNTQFKDLGRTDALHVINNTTWSQDGKVTHQGTNNEARYALHMHKVRTKFLLEGNVITGSVVNRNLNNTIERAVFGAPKWGIVNHDSFGDITNNVVVGVAGAGIVGEDGTETGTVRGNIVIGTGQGTGGGDDGRFAPEKGNDLAYGGFGYWFRGPYMNVDNNIATGYFKQGGFGYFLHPDFTFTQLPNIEGMPEEYKGKNINVNSRSIRSFANNKATGLFGDAGFIIFYTGMPHTIANMDIVNRNTKGKGLDIEYTKKLELADSRVKGHNIALFTNKETKEVVTPRTAFSGFSQLKFTR